MSSEEDTATRQRVADPEEFNQQRRLRSIHDARDRARVTYEDTQDPRVNEDYQTRAANYRAKIQSYIGELEGLLQTYDFEDSDFDEDYWKGVRLGPLTVSPPRELVELREQKDVSVIGDSELKPTEYTIPGLKGYLDAAEQCPIQEQFNLHIRRRHKGQETVTGVSATEMPIQVSHAAFRTANLFVSNTGLDVELESGMSEFGFEEVDDG